MHFCDKCDNMYYINISEESDNIYYYCKKCGNLDNSMIFSTVNISLFIIPPIMANFSLVLEKFVGSFNLK